MKNKKALEKMCLHCEMNLVKLHKGCALRNLSNDFCPEYKQVEKALKKLEYIESIERKYMINAVACMTLMGEKVQAKAELQIRNEDTREW